MPSYALSRSADRDLEGIARTSAQQWGFSRAEAYLSSLHRAFEIIAQFPDVGRDASGLRPGYLRFEHERHSVFYRRAKGGVLVVRVLHVRMQPQKHL